MKGNIFISVPQADISNELPAAITRYDWTESTYNEEGEVVSTTTIHPTWVEYGNKYKAAYGTPVAVSDGGTDYVVYEITASWLSSEVSALVALGAGLTAPSYTLMTSEEARAFIANNAQDLV